MRKYLCLILSLAMLLYAAVPACGEESRSDDVVILYTNDVHTHIDGPLSYDVIAGIKRDLETKYKYVLLADAGDHVQGTAYGAMDKGKSIITLMNAAGYDVATLGNHEFDYGMQGCIAIREWADFPYVSCNFYHEENAVRGDNVLDSYVIFDCGAQKVAFIGVTTPETLTSTTPTYFQDENGAYIYGISGSDDGAALQADVQAAIDAARAAGATTVIALGHLGVDENSLPCTSRETIANTSGLDAFIDGHSHTVIEAEEVTGRDGRSALLTQTGEYFGRIGMMVIDSETGAITTDFIEAVELAENVINENGEEEKIVVGYALSSDLYSGTEPVIDPDVSAIKDAWIDEIDRQLGEVIGSTDLVFDNYTPDGKRLVRIQETNSGDFAADALYWLFDDIGLDVDVAIMNGGGVRNTAVTGEISYKTCKTIHPFGNVACLQTITGQQLLDALEWGSRAVGSGAEDGSFLHVAGATYTVDSTCPSTSLEGANDVWLGGPDGEYRVRNVKVYNKETNAWDDLDLAASYNLAGYNYTLRDLGGGFAMFNDAVNVLDYVMEDYMVLANYVQAFEGGVIEANNSPLMARHPGLNVDYGTVNGSGRIHIILPE